LYNGEEITPLLTDMLNLRGGKMRNPTGKRHPREPLEYNPRTIPSKNVDALEEEIVDVRHWNLRSVFEKT